MGRRRTSRINCLLAIDKPVGCTSHDVVAQVRRVLHERRVGHAGTLDPMASGVMVLGVGQATRLLGHLTLEKKSYIARIVFGSETNTDDAEGEVTRTAPVPSACADEPYAQELLASFLGPSEQVPPQFSAISVNGVRAYKRSRNGEEVELPPRPIVVESAVLLGLHAEGDEVAWDVAFTVSKGTYIRALARDIGRAAASAAHVGALRRTASGTVGLAVCRHVEDLEGLGEADLALDPVAALGVPAVVLPEDVLADVLCGKRVPAWKIEGQGLVPEPFGADERCAIIIGGRLMALAWFDGAELVFKDVFPEGIGGVICRD